MKTHVKIEDICSIFEGFKDHVLMVIQVKEAKETKDQAKGMLKIRETNTE
jgi:hypothetical protein